VNEKEQLIGYEALVINENPTDIWVSSATLLVDVLVEAPCMGDLNVLTRYLVHLAAGGEVESYTQNGTTLYKSKIGGVVAEETGTRYRVEGTMIYTDNCQVRTWSVQIRIPLNVRVPARGRARIQLLFSVDESSLVEEKKSGSWMARTQTGFQEKERLILELQQGGQVEISFEGEMTSLMSSLLINSIVDKGSKPK
jgi:hypothetical protein